MGENEMELKILEYVAENGPTTCYETCTTLAESSEEKQALWSTNVDLKYELKLAPASADEFTVSDEALD